MNREEMTILGFEIVAYAGDARSKLLEALKAAISNPKRVISSLFTTYPPFYVFTILYQSMD